MQQTQEQDKEEISIVHKSICKLLDDAGIVYRKVKHEPTQTSEESAKQRGEDLCIGGKAILMKLEGNYFQLFVLSAAKMIDSNAIKSHLNIKKLRFATSEELFELYKLVPGSVPPFGSPILEGLKLFLDTDILKNKKIAFNAGSLTNSIVMDMKDYLSVSSPVMFRFSK
jgi:Ala-tRNA(Pro) deacylase